MPNLVNSFTNFSLFSILLILQTFLSLNVKAQNPLLPPCTPLPRTPCLVCPTTPVPFNNPYIWNSNETSNQLSCEIGIQRLLARSAEAQWLGDFIRPIGCEPGYSPIPVTSTLNCDPPYNQCNSTYCPAKYCELINFFANSDISFLGRVYKAGYHEFETFPCEDWYRRGRQLVDEINFAYDCRGKMRPVIQAFMGEVVSAKNFESAYRFDTTQKVTTRSIPQPLIDLYFQYYGNDAGLPSFASPTIDNFSYYNNSIRYFTEANMFTNGQLDISKVEARMWFLYQAITFIDMGYTAIHMGLYTSYARSGTNGNDPGYNHLFQLTQNIRDYATGSPCGFVLLSGETPYENIDNGLSPKWGDTEQLIFDFDSRAMRAREIAQDANGNPISGDGDIDASEGGLGCDQPINPVDLLAFNSSPCSTGLFPAVVDPCTINSAGGTSGGISPMGCTYEQVPYLVHWDGNSGQESTCPDSPCSTPCTYFGGVASNGPTGHTWGYDDNRWFGQPNGLTDACRRWWFDYFFCQRRNYHGGNGFLMIPATLTLHQNENCNPNMPDPDGNYLIIDDPAFVNVINSSTLDVKMPVINVKEFCAYDHDYECFFKCRNQNPPFPFYKWYIGTSYYMFTVANKDCSSIYSFHVRDPNNNWLTPVVSDTMFLFPQFDGSYSITLRQDNLGLTPPSTFGTREITITEEVVKECCKPVTIQECGLHSLNLTTNCVGGDLETLIYGFQISSSNPNGMLMDVHSYDKNTKILDVQNSSTNQISGRVQLKNTPYPKVDLMVKYYKNWPTGGGDTIRLLKYPNPCLSPRSQEISATPPLTNATLDIIPNPGNDYVDLIYNSLNEEIGSISVFNSMGQAFSVEKQNFTKGENRFHLNIAEWPSGVYFALITSSGRPVKGKFVKRD